MVIEISSYQSNNFHNEKQFFYSSDSYIRRNFNATKNILGMSKIDDFRRINVLPIVSFSLLCIKKWSDT